MSVPSAPSTVFEGTPDELATFVKSLPAKRYHIEIVDLGDSAPEKNYLADAVRQALERTPEQMLADRADVMAGVRKGASLPPGKTLDDVVKGKWPGDETDEQIRAALEELS